MTSAWCCDVFSGSALVTDLCPYEIWPHRGTDLLGDHSLIRHPCTGSQLLLRKLSSGPSTILYLLCCAESAERAAAGVLHMCFELTQHDNSIAGILPGLAAILQKHKGLLHACLPSLALLAQLSPQSTADAIMDDMLPLCSELGSAPCLLRGMLANITLCLFHL